MVCSVVNHERVASCLTSISYMQLTMLVAVGKICRTVPRPGRNLERIPRHLIRKLEPMSCLHDMKKDSSADLIAVRGVTKQTIDGSGKLPISSYVQVRQP